jgi:hypothetical protein
VAEAVLVGGELDAAIGAVGVEPVEILRRERRGVAPDVLVIAVGEGVLDVELEVVHAQARQSDNSFIDLDNSRILAEFGKFDFTPIETGIARTYAHIKKQFINMPRTS